MPGSSHLARMITPEQLSDQLGGQLSAHSLRRLARQGRVTGACKIGSRYFFDSRTASWLVQDLTSPIRLNTLPAKVWGEAS